MDNSVVRAIDAAEGWLELGNVEAANDEIENLAPNFKNLSEVLAMRCRIYRQGERWRWLEILAESCAELYPDEVAFRTDWAWALYKQGQLNGALAILESAEAHFQNSQPISYQMACVLTILDRIPEAEQWLKTATTRADEPKEMLVRALDQPELQKLWQNHAEGLARNRKLGTKD